MRFLVTGAGGFIGSRVSELLLERGHQVFVAERPGSNYSRLNGLGIERFSVEETLDIQKTAGSLSRLGIDCLLNFAWDGVANFARNDANQYRNIGLTEAWNQIAIKSGIRHIVGAGSQAEYGPVQGIISEEQPLLPLSMYGVSKAAAGLSTRASCTLAGLEFSWIRIFSTYGPGDSAHWMIQEVITKLLKNSDVELTEGRQMWDFLFVDDAAMAFVLVAEGEEGLGFVNLGSGMSLEIRDVIQKLSTITNSKSKLEFGKIPYREDQVMHLEADITKLTMATSWTPLVGIDDGLTRTVNSRRWQH